MCGVFLKKVTVFYFWKKKVLGHRFYDVLMINNVSYLQWLHLFQKAACQMDFLAIKIG